MRQCEFPTVCKQHHSLLLLQYFDAKNTFVWHKLVRCHSEGEDLLSRLCGCEGLPPCVYSIQGDVCVIFKLVKLQREGERERERETYRDRQADRRTDIQRHTYRDRQTDRQTDR